MGKWKTIAPIVISIVIAVAGSVFIYRWINLKTAPKEVVKVASDAVPIVVAAVDLQWGTQLKPEMIKTAPFLEESLPEGHFTRTADLNNRVVIASIKKGEPLSNIDWRRLVSKPAVFRRCWNPESGRWRLKATRSWEYPGS